MLRLAVCASLAVLGFVSVSYAQSSRSYDALIATHAAANRVPESLVRRVILRESRYNADLVGHGGTIGLMQIKRSRRHAVLGTPDPPLDCSIRTPT
jgi:soluble lytic murein transglycosylase-like protein